MHTPILFLVIGLSLMGAPKAAADTAASDALSQSQHASGGVHSSRATETRERPQRLATQVNVVFVGTVAKETNLAAVIEELLTARGATMTSRQVDVLQEVDLLNPSLAGDSSKIRIWITLPRRGLVRLWFAAPSLDRYAWRDVPLADEFDAVGREQIAQIVQSSAEALYQGELGFTRSVAQKVWQQQQQPPAQAPSAREFSLQAAEETRGRATPQRAIVRAGRVSSRPNRALKEPLNVGPFLGVGYTLVRNAAELGWLHGPLLTLGINYALLRDTIGVHMAGEWHLPQRFAGEVASVELQSKTVWLMLQWSDTRSPHAGFTSSLGAGVEFAHVAPMAKEATGFVARTAYTDRGYLSRLRGGVQGKLGWFAWIVNAGVDLSLSKTSYGVDTDQGYSSLLSLWQVRPGMELVGRFE